MAKTRAVSQKKRAIADHKKDAEEANVWDFEGGANDRLTCKPLSRRECK
jgi:hypothetical protein